MSVLNEVPITSLTDLMTFIEPALEQAKPHFLWFRGCGNALYPLKPSIYRHPSLKTEDEFLQLEMNLIDRFAQRWIPFQTRDTADSWELLFIMQHFGVPTRLLDWTENPTVALYFALTGARANPRNPDAAIWVVNPVMWNKGVLSHMPAERVFLPIELRGHVPATEPTVRRGDRNSPAVFLYGTYNSPRIVAQRGTFCIFGTSQDPMENYFKGSALPDEALVKLVIPNANVEDLLKSITALGMTDSVVFPDLEGLGREIKRHFEFGF